MTNKPPKNTTEWTLDEAGVIQMMHKRIEMQEISQAEYARQIGVSRSYLTDLFQGKRSPGKKILDALGLERVVMYRRKADANK